MRKNVDKYISKNFNGKYSQKLLDHVKQSATDVAKFASKTTFKRTLKELMIWLAITLLIKLQVSRTPLQNSSGAVLNEEKKY